MTQWQGLFHDMAETYVGDLVRPIKVMLPQFHEIEHLSWRIIANKFLMPTDIDPLVEKADKDLCAVERFHLCARSGNHTWTEYGVPDDLPCKGHFLGWPSWFARFMWRREYRRLKPAWYK
jgi:hypothetical protein